MSALATVVHMEGAVPEGHVSPGEPWMYGIFAFVVLLVLLLLVTRLNNNR